MNLEQAKSQIKRCAGQMDARYGTVVFDEWAVVSLAGRKLRVFGYEGARQQGFKKHFLTDAGGLRPSLLTRQHHPGDFEFSHTGVTTGFESFMALGPDVFLIWNNTAKSMDTISEEPRWLSAQVPFVELSETFRADPLSAPI